MNTLNGELEGGKLTHSNKGKRNIELPEFTTKIENREYIKNNSFDIRNVLDIQSSLKIIKNDWTRYIKNIGEWIIKSPLKKIAVTFSFTVILSVMASNASASITEYTYQVQKADTLSNIAVAHGVTPQEVLDANGIKSISEGTKILLPKVEDRVVNASTLIVRSQPSIKSEVLGGYKKGDIVKVADIQSGWAQILIKGRVAYVYAEYLSQNKSVPTVTTKSSSQAKEMYVNTSLLTIRAGATINSSAIGSLKQNEKVWVISINNGWAQIEYKGVKSYVSAQYLSETKPINNETPQPKASEVPFDIKMIDGSTRNQHFVYYVDHTEGNYKIVQYFEAMPDHIATLGWFAVDPVKKKAYDITYDPIIKVDGKYIHQSLIEK